MDLSSNVVVKNEYKIKKIYFNEVFIPAFDKLVEMVNPIEKRYIIAGKNICINYYSKEIFNKLSKALIHNEDDFTTNADLTINAIDSSRLKRRLILPIDNFSKYISNDNIQDELQSDGIFFGFYNNWLNETLQIYDGKNSMAYFWVCDAQNIPMWISSAPFRPIFNLFFYKKNIHLLHGAVVGINGKSVLITAKGGSGKSTTALSCLFDGMDYIGDDYVIISSSNNLIESHSIFSSIKIHEDSLDFFPEIKNKIWNKNYKDSDEKKALIFLNDFFSNRIVRKTSVDAILIPTIKNTRHTKISKISKINAMLAMIPTTLFQSHLTSSKEVSDLKSIIDKVPCYSLELGYDIPNISKIIKLFLLNEHEK